MDDWAFVILRNWEPRRCAVGGRRTFDGDNNVFAEPTVVVAGKLFRMIYLMVAECIRELSGHKLDLNSGEINIVVSLQKGPRIASV